MKQHTIQTAIALALLASSAVHAQDAVQWKVANGGNGHWYTWRPCATGVDANIKATELHGDLVSIVSVEENEHARQILAESGRTFAMLGYIQADNQPGPEIGWAWSSGEPTTFTNWTDFDGGYGFVAPDDRPCAGATAAEDNQCNQGIMYPDGRWDDIERGPSCGGFASSSVAIIEWSADCNNDNIVDYGQCRDGTLLDTNGNNVPDSCEGSHQPIHGYDFQSGVLDQFGAVNGVLVNGASISNGSLYTDGIDDYVQFPEQIIPTSGPFTVALRFRTTAIPTGWMELISQGCSGCGSFYLGRALNAQWRYWLDNADIQTGIPYPADSSWHDVAATYQPDGITKLYVDAQLVAQYVAPPLTATGQPTRLACQFDFQEHHQGYIDVLRIYDVALTAAEIAHLTNSCVGDILVDRIINGADLGALLSYWGPVTSSPVSMSCDLNGDGLVNGGDLGMLLANWGTCPN